MTTRHALLMALLAGLPAPLSVALAAPPETAPPADVFFRAPAQNHCLDSGLRVRTHSIAGAQHVTVSVTLRPGDDPGAALLATKLALHAYTLPPEPPPPPPPEDGTEPPPEAPEVIGPPPPPPPSVAQRLQALGAQADLVAGPDLITLTASAPPAALPGILSALGQWLAAPLDNVTDADLEHEKVALSLHTVRPDLEPWRLVAPALLGASHPYAGPGELGGMTLARVQKTADALFAAENLTLTVTGDLGPIADARPFFAAALAGAPIPMPTGPAITPGEDGPARVVIADASCVTAPVAPRSLPGPTPPTAARTEVAAGVAAPLALMTWGLPSSYGPDALSLELLPIIAEEFIARGLREHATPGQRPPDLISCTVLPGLQTSALVCAMPMGRAGDEKKVTAPALTALDALWYTTAPGALKEALPDLKQRLKGRLTHRAAAFAAGEPAVLHDDIAYDLLTGDLYPALARISEADNLDAKDLLGLLRTWLVRDRVALVGVLPDGSRTDVGADLLAGLTVDGPWAPLPPPWEPPPPPPPDPEKKKRKEKKAAEPSPEPEVIEPPPRLTVDELAAMAANPLLDRALSYTLDSGLQVVVVERPGFPMVQATLIHAGGPLRAPSPAVDEAAWYLTAPGEAPDWPLAGRAPWTQYRAPGAWLRGLSVPVDNLDDAIAVLGATARGASVDLAGKSDYLGRVGKRYRPTAWRSLRLSGLDRFLGDGHPLAEPPITKKDRKAAVEEAATWAAAVVHPHATTLLVIGPVSGEEVRAAAEKALGDWRGTGTAAISRPLPMPQEAPAQGALIFDDPVGPAARAELRCPVGEPSAAGQDLLVDMLSLEMGEALRAQPLTNLRVRAESLGEDGQAWLHAAFDAPPAHIGRDITALRTVMADYLADLDLYIAELEFEAARMELVAAVQANLDENGKKTRKIKQRLETFLVDLDHIATLETLPERKEAFDKLKAAYEADEEPLKLAEAAEKAAEEARKAAEAAGEPIIEEIIYPEAPRPTLETARAHRAAAWASAYGTPEALTRQIVAWTSAGQPIPTSREYALALYDTDEYTLQAQLQRCVGHDFVTVEGPAEAVAAALTSAGISFETLDAKAAKKR